MKVLVEIRGSEEMYSTSKVVFYPKLLLRRADTSKNGSLFKHGLVFHVQQQIVQNNILSFNISISFSSCTFMCKRNTAFGICEISFGVYTQKEKNH
jgi:hypothetical protein